MKAQLKRITSGMLAILLPTIMTLNSLISVNASEFQWSGAQKIRVKNQERPEIEMTIESKDAGIVDGENIDLDIYIRNNTQDPIEDGLLSVADTYLISDLYFETEENSLNELDITEIDASADDSASAYEISDIGLAPGEVYKVHFHADMDYEEVEQLELGFYFTGTSGEKEVSQYAAYKCVVGGSAMLPIVFENDGVLTTTDNHSVYLMTRTNRETFEESDDFVFEDEDELAKEEAEKKTTPSNLPKAQEEDSDLEEDISEASKAEETLKTADEKEISEIEEEDFTQSLEETDSTEVSEEEEMTEALEESEAEEEEDDSQTIKEVEVPKSGPEIFDESYDPNKKAPEKEETEEVKETEKEPETTVEDKSDLPEKEEQAELEETEDKSAKAETIKETDATDEIKEPEDSESKAEDINETEETEEVDEETKADLKTDVDSETEVEPETKENTKETEEVSETDVVPEETEDDSTKADVATDSNAKENPDAYEGADAETASYVLNMYGATLDQVSAVYAERLSDEDYLVSKLDFSIGKNTEPGLYFGNIEETVEINGEKYKLTQGFHFYVSDNENISLTAETKDGGTVTVSGPRESFPDGDVLSLVLSDIPEDVMPDVQEAMQQMAEKNRISVDKMRALDIKVMADGEVCELSGPVEVTFKSLKMEDVKKEEKAADEINKISANSALPAFEDPGIEEPEILPAVENEKKTSEPEITYDEDGNKIVNTEAINQAIEDYIATLVPEEEAEAEAEDKEETFAVWHYDPTEGIDEMESKNNENGDVVMTTDHFSIFIVVEIPSDSKIDVIFQHWSNMDVIGKSATENWASPWTPTITDYIFDKTSLSSYTHKEKTQIYTSDTYELPNRLNTDIAKMSKVARTGNYTISEVWVINNYDKLSAAKKSAAETADWTGLTKGTDYQVYTSSNVKLNSNSLIRIWYTANTDQSYKNSVTFYDHNIYDGKAYKKSSFGTPYILTYQLANMYQKNSSYGYLNGKNQGINQDKFLTGTGSAVIGSGQSVSGNKSTWQSNKWTGKLNGVSKSYSLNAGNTTIGPGMIHGLIDVEATKKSNTLKYVSGIKAPDFFAENTYDLGGTTAYASKQFNYKLQFNRVGDTYTLAKVLDGSGAPATGDLTKFYAWSGNNSRPDNTKIFSNEFWPLDTVDTYPGMDPMCGAYSNSWLSQNDFAPQIHSGEVKTVKNINGAHNWHFGMKYEFDFTIGDYTGPLRYYFRGDDDYYVFLDDELVIDNGGIVGSIKGQSVDLRKWLSGDATEVERAGGAAPSTALKNAYASDKDHVYHLKIYSMERGGFGSCCYFTFQLPLVNNYTPPEGDKGSTSVNVKKVWNDYNNPLRPNTVEVVLKQDGIDYRNASLNAENGWSYTFTNLPEKDVNDKAYVYTIDEVEPPEGYTGKTTGDAKSGFIITNSLSPEVKVKVTKVWDDNDNECGERKDTVFQLYADGMMFGDGQTLKKEDTELVFEHLPKYLPVYSNGEIIAYSEIEYTVDEMDGTEPLAVGDTIAGSHGDDPEHLYKLTNKRSIDLTSDEIADNVVKHFEFTNTHTHQIYVSKEWSDGNENHADTIYVGLYANGSPVAGSYLALSPSNDYSGVFSGLDPAKDYTVKELTETPRPADFTIGGVKYIGLNEDGIYNDMYVASYDVDDEPCKKTYVITNTLDTLYVTKTVTKVWNDFDNRYGKRPDSLKVQLYQDGVEYGDPKEMAQKNGDWSEIVWEDLPKYKIVYTDGYPEKVKYEYTVKEVPDYENHEYYEDTYPADMANSETVTITNSLKTAKLRIAKWIDNWDEDLENNDLLEDDFIIRVEGEDVDTELVLRHAGVGNSLDESKLSGFIVPSPDEGIEVTIKEIAIPKEYEYRGLTETTDLSSPFEKTVSGNKIVLKARENKIVVVHNSFEHEDYFHDDDRAMNDFGGGGTEPISKTGWDISNLFGLIRTPPSISEIPLDEDFVLK